MSENRWRGERWFDHDKTNKIRHYTHPNKNWAVRYGKIEHAMPGLMYDIPWVFAGEFQPCGIRHEVYWSQFKIIPKLCRESCWKVVIKPQTVHELYQFHRLQTQMHMLEGFNGKCGLDVRWYTSAPYAGFWYNKNREEGQLCYERTVEYMRESDYFSMLFAREEATGEDLITLKKGCTEFQHPREGGIRSSEWQTHPNIPHWDEEESRLNDIFDHDGLDHSGPQPTWLINKIIYMWCEFAHQIGDPTYRDVLGHDPFEYTEDTYHKKGGDTEVDDQSVENPN